MLHLLETVIRNYRVSVTKRQIAKDYIEINYFGIDPGKDPFDQKAYISGRMFSSDDPTIVENKLRKIMYHLRRKIHCYER